jgi:hypothetical protein
MLTHKWTTLTFSLLMLHLTFAFCNGQTTNDLNSTPVHEQHPRIVRTSGTKSEVVHCELLDKDGNLWFSISGEGAYRYDGRSFTNLTTKDGLCDNRVAAMIQGKSGSFFLGTNNGIGKYDGKKFTTIPMTDTLSITSLFEVHPGLSWESTKWVGAGGNLRLLACCELSAHIGKRASEWFGCR